MIVSKDINPNRNLYYTGSQVIKILNNMESDKVDILDVYKVLNKKEKISMPILVLTFDWLFLLGFVDISNDGIKKCL